MHFFRPELNRTSLLAVLMLACVVLFPGFAAHSAEKKPFVVVIDAGHGGNDTGAIENEVKEKDVNLSVARKLGELIKKKLKDTEVIYTRTNDTFISLQKRAEIANNAKADLFISIHCNSVDKSNKNRSNVVGATTYVIGRHKDADNLAVAKRENSVVELDADDKAHFAQFDPSQDESYIIFEMTQKKNFQNSIRFAADVQKEMAAAGRYSRGVQQAGFWVLWSTAMPAALIELDFICNPEQAKFLSSKEGQDKLADAIFNAVKKYEDYFRKSLGSETEFDYTTAQSSAEDVAPAATEVSSRAREETVGKTTPSASSSSATASRRSRRRNGKRNSSEVQQAVITVREENSQTLTASTENFGYASEDKSGSNASQKSDTDSKKAKKEKEKAREKEKKKAQEKQKEKSGKSTATVTPGKPARRDKGSSGKRKNLRQEVHIVYKILLFTSGEELKLNNEAFKGLSSVAVHKKNNMYNYTYGESPDREEMETELMEIKQLFPEAYIIRIIN